MTAVIRMVKLRPGVITPGSGSPWARTRASKPSRTRRRRRWPRASGWCRATRPALLVPTAVPRCQLEVLCRGAGRGARRRAQGSLVVAIDGIPVASGEQVRALLGDAGPTAQVRSWCSARSGAMLRWPGLLTEDCSMPAVPAGRSRRGAGRRAGRVRARPRRRLRNSAADSRSESGLIYYIVDERSGKATMRTES